MRVASAGLVYWVTRFFLLGTKARILGLTHTLFVYPFFFLNLKPSFCSRIQSRTFCCTESLCFLRLLQTGSVSQPCFIFYDLLRSIVQVFGKMSFNLDLSDIFLKVRVGLCHHQYITSKECVISMTYWWCKPRSSDWGYVWQVYPLMFISSLTFFFFLEHFFLKLRFLGFKYPSSRVIVYISFPLFLLKYSWFTKLC